MEKWNRATCHPDKFAHSNGLCLSCSGKARKLKQYGFTLEQHAELLSAQNHVCAICKRPESVINNRSTQTVAQRLAIDHCHRTGKTRGLLCHKCNIGLGCFRDSPRLLLVAIFYLLKHVTIRLLSSRRV